MAGERTLIKLANDAEDVAAGLLAFRDGIPDSATRITGTITEIYAVSTRLREIDGAHAEARSAPSFYQVQDDLSVIIPTLRATLDAAFDMFARSRGRPYSMAWDDLAYRMEQQEGMSFIGRLEWYNDLLRAQTDVLSGYRTRDLGGLRRQILLLLDAQQALRAREQRQTIDAYAANTPRPPPPRPRVTRLDTPISPTTASNDSWDMPMSPGSMPRAPEPPLGPVPTSPTFTSSSSHTLSSSQTSYSDEAFVQSPPMIHWAQAVFDGTNPCTSFYPSYRLQESSSCYGKVENSALSNLVRDGFVKALELSFDGDRLWLRLYFRPADSRARILLTTKDSRSRDVHYCAMLTNLKVIRDASSLQLCRAKRDGRYEPWARLNFIHHERMVLFYCTFVAMKRQDSQPVPSAALEDSFELEGTTGEYTEFGGIIQHGNLHHALRLYNDRSSGVLRLEASASRGPMQDVPLWTAFVNRYIPDVAWAEYQGAGLVNLAALKPPPYVFLAGYEPPKNRNGEYILQFTDDNDARFFVEVWARLCRSGG